ncbi:MAG: hypothetical protein NKF70_14065 [Methanobacterium sp. ERen5]|nr:MAG: hypothetical protein NKF70_14065 [Methanobacterium sp. ERen5]
MQSDPIEKYINKVTKNMGSKQREEVGRELKAHILDSADALAEEKNVEVDDTIIQETIKRMGPAEDIADMYPEEKAGKDNIIDGLKYITRSLVFFVVAASIIGIVLQLIFKDLSLYPFVVVAIIVYLVIMGIHFVKRKFIPKFLQNK